jgi:iron complex outermembrane receptor protein
LEYAGTQGPIVLSAGAGTPKDKGTLSLTWDRGPWAVTGAVNYVGPLKMIDHKGETVTDNGDGTVTDNTNGLVQQYNGNGNLGCAVYDNAGNAFNRCRVPSFTTFDLFTKWTPIKNLDINFSIQNLFDRKAPFDPYLVLTYGINYNQTWHQAGAVGRFFTLGAKYTF